MSTPVLDPRLPADNSPLSSGEMRGQFQAIQNNFDDLRARLIALTPLGLTVSNPPSAPGLPGSAQRPAMLAEPCFLKLACRPRMASNESHA